MCRKLFLIQENQSKLYELQLLIPALAFINQQSLQEAYNITSSATQTLFFNSRQTFVAKSVFRQCGTLGQVNEGPRMFESTEQFCLRSRRAKTQIEHSS